MSDLTQIIITIISTIGTIAAAWLGYRATVESNKQKKELKKDNSDEKKKFATSQLSSLNKWRFIWFITFLFFGIATIIAYFIYFKNDIGRDKKIVSVSKPLIEQIDQGVIKSKEYIIPTILMNVIFDSVGDHLEADVTLIYNILQINTAKRKDKVFDDFYRLTRGGEMLNLVGSDDISENPSGWNFSYPIEPGVYRITTSHFKIKYPRSLAAYKPEFFDSLTNYQEVFDYNNSQNDIIGEVLITVSSSTLNFHKPSPSDAAIGVPKTTPRYIEPTIDGAAKGNYSIITARFKNVGPDEHAQLRVQWR